VVDESKKTMYWVVCLIILFVLFIVIAFALSGGFVTLGTRILLPIINDMFGADSLTALLVQGVISVMVLIVLIFCLWYGRKREWL
jgi:uncharacterized BrkB/YihY/UPF0761 family membrane protein